MVAYNAFNVDPQRYQQNTMANIANAARYSGAMNQQARQNAFAEQQARAQSEENAFNRTLKVREENRATRKEGREQSAEKRDSLKFKYEMMGKQVDDFGRILDTVTDPRTHEMARAEVANRVHSGLLPPQFLDRFPQQYDPMALSYGKQFINVLKQKIASDYANITTVDESGITRVRPYRKTEGIELGKSEKTIDKYKADLKSKTRDGKYTISQQINDAEQYYGKMLDNAKNRYMNADLDDESYGKLHKQLMSDMRDDIRLIKDGKEPSYLTDKVDSKQDPKIESKGKIMRTGFHKGRKVIQYEDGSIEYAPDTHRQDRKH